MARPGHCSWSLVAAVEGCLDATSPLSFSLFEGWGGQYVSFPCIYSANIFLVHLVCPPAPCLALDEAHTF